MSKSLNCHRLAFLASTVTDLARVLDDVRILFCVFPCKMTMLEQNKTKICLDVQWDFLLCPIAPLEIAFVQCHCASFQTTMLVIRWICGYHSSTSFLLKMILYERDSIGTQQSSRQKDTSIMPGENYHLKPIWHQDINVQFRTALTRWLTCSSRGFRAGGGPIGCTLRFWDTSLGCSGVFAPTALLFNILLRGPGNTFPAGLLRLASFVGPTFSCKHCLCVNPYGHTFNNTWVKHTSSDLVICCRCISFSWHAVLRSLHLKKRNAADACLTHIQSLSNPDLKSVNSVQTCGMPETIVGYSFKHCHLCLRL